MTSMPLYQQIIIIAVCVAGTMLTRFLPFLVFKESKPIPAFVQYLGKALPSPVFAMLVVYCLRNVHLTGGAHGIPEAIAVAVTTVLYLLRQEMLLPIAGGTAVYMYLVQKVFIS